MEQSVDPILTREEIADLLAPTDNELKRQEFLKDSDSPLTDDLEPSGEKPGDRAKDPDASAFDEEQMPVPNLAFVLDSFAQCLSARLTTVLRRPFWIERGEMRISSFAETLPGLNEEGAVAVYASPSLQDACFVHLDRPLAFCLLETILGSTAAYDEIVVPERKLSSIETALMKSALTIVCQCLEKSMARAKNARFQLVRIENGFRLLKSVHDEDKCVTVFFPVRLNEDVYGTLHLIVPFRMLEHLREDFAALVDEVALRAPGDDVAPACVSGILEMACCLKVCAPLSIAEDVDSVLNLSAGGFLELTQDPFQRVMLILEENTLFHAVSLVEEGKRSVRVTARMSVSAQDTVVATNEKSDADATVFQLEKNEVVSEKKKLSIEIGRITMLMKDVLRVNEGMVIPLDKPVDTLLDLYIGSRFFARGEMVRLGKKSAIRLVEICSEDDRIKALAK